MRNTIRYPCDGVECDNTVPYLCESIECDNPIILFELLLEEVIITVDCLICKESKHVSLSDFLLGDNPLICHDHLLLPYIRVGDDMHLDLLCSRCLTRNVFPLRSVTGAAINSLRLPQLIPEPTEVERIFH